MQAKSIRLLYSEFFEASDWRFYSDKPTSDEDFLAKFGSFKGKHHGVETDAQKIGYKVEFGEKEYSCWLFLLCFLWIRAWVRGTHFYKLSLVLSSLGEIKNWWNLNSPRPKSVNELFLWGSTAGLKGKKLLTFNTVLFSFCWSIWDYRNNRIFNKKSVSLVFLLNN